MSDIKVERKGEVTWIRLDRPDRMNAYDAKMAQALIDAIEGRRGQRRDRDHRNR